MLARLPDGVTPAMAAGSSDNIADAYRTVAYALEERPGASVLIAGNHSIALYAVWWARALGAGNVTLCSRDAALLERAAALGAAVEHVDAWPKRFRTHEITVDCTGEPAGLAAVIRSTQAYGRCTSASIFFGGDVAVPMFDMNMKGIRFDTGRVNGAALMPTVLELIARHRLRPETIAATVTPWAQMSDALIGGAFKPIAVRDATLN
jgi:threonine dehydrogenase-like Zn-dependent dehydrogenase